MSLRATQDAAGRPLPETEPAAELDLCRLPIARRHAAVYAAFDALAPGECLLLANDHDPKPLYYQLRFQRKGQFVWEALEQGPQVWRVRLRRTARRSAEEPGAAMGPGR
jgi:uncharacterized protein (DUF2249 family)